MKWLCSECGQSYRQHTIEEIETGRCQHDPPPPPEPKFTATEYGKISPEAVEDSGEDFEELKKLFNFKRWPRLPEE